MFKEESPLIKHNTYAVACTHKDKPNESHMFLFIGPENAYSVASKYAFSSYDIWDVKIWRGTHTLLLNKGRSMSEPMLHSVRGGYLSLIDIDELKRDNDAANAESYSDKAEQEINASKLSTDEQN